MKIKTIYDGVAKRMSFLGNVFHENSLFVSQHTENDEKHATVVVQTVDRDDDNDYLALRRLLKALEYRISSDTEFDLSFNLKRKAKK